MGSFLIFFLMFLFIVARVDGFNNITNNITHNTIILLGDSMLNNSNYVQQSIPQMLLMKTPNVLNLATDGSLINGCYSQINKIPIELNNSNSYMFISVGGNNILNTKGTVDTSVIHTLFNEYMALLQFIKTKLPTVILTVLNLYLPTNSQYKSYADYVHIWNSLIQTNAYTLYNVIDTNNLLTQSADFIYGIEPSEIGGEKIANAIYEQTTK
jgi:hypothetical protein